MRVLFDNGTPRGLGAALSGHSVEEARARGWDTLKNGELLTAAEAAGFEVFVTTDKNIQHQQNLAGRRLAVVILSNSRWALIRLKFAEIRAVVSVATPGSVAVVAI